MGPATWPLLGAVVIRRATTCLGALGAFGQAALQRAGELVGQLGSDEAFEASGRGGTMSNVCGLRDKRTLLPLNLLVADSLPHGDPP